PLISEAVEIDLRACTTARLIIDEVDAFRRNHKLTRHSSIKQPTLIPALKRHLPDPSFILLPNYPAVSGVVNISSQNRQWNNPTVLGHRNSIAAGRLNL